MMISYTLPVRFYAPNMISGVENLEAIVCENNVNACLPVFDYRIA